MDELFQKITTEFSPILTERKVKKNQFLHLENKVCQELHLVQSGALRAFYHLDGKEVTAHFALEAGAVTAPDSFIFGKVSKYNIQALEDSTIQSVNRNDLEQYLDDHPHLERLARKFTEAFYIGLLERIDSLVFLSAKERYADLIQHHPSIIQRISLGHIASYLGITQETLSRVRGQS